MENVLLDFPNDQNVAQANLTFGHMWEFVDIMQMRGTEDEEEKKHLNCLSFLIYCCTAMCVTWMDTEKNKSPAECFPNEHCVSCNFL